MCEKQNLYVNTSLEKENKMAECKKQCEVYSHIVGYFRPVKNSNPGKQEEFRIRKTFKIKEEAKICCLDKQNNSEKKPQQKT